MENRAELEVFGFPLEVRIEASCVPAPREATGGEATRLLVAFRRVALTLGKLPSLIVPLSWITTGRDRRGGWTRRTWTTI